MHGVQEINKHEPKPGWRLDDRERERGGENLSVLWRRKCKSSESSKKPKLVTIKTSRLRRIDSNLRYWTTHVVLALLAVPDKRVGAKYYVTSSRKTVISNLKSSLQ
jgi:hypothetical protein